MKGFTLMKKTRIVSFAVVLICMLLNFGTLSFADNSAENQEAELLVSLNIVSPKFVRQDKVTRADFAIAVAKSFNTGFNEDYYASENPFADLYKYEPYSGIYTYLKSLGIISGDENNKFHKRDIITVEQAYIIALRALGYDVSKSADYSKNPLNLASSLKIKVSKPVDSELSSEDAIHILYKMLFVQTFFEANLNVQQRRAIQDSTFLNHYWRISETIGVVKSDGTVSMQTGIAATRNKVIIGVETYIDTKNLAYGMAGYRVKAYIDEDDNICCIQKYNNDEIEILSGDIAESYKNDFKIKYIYKNSTKTLNLSSMFCLVYNGFPATGVSNIIPTDGSIKLVDNNGDGKYDVIFSNEWQYMFVDTVNFSEKKIVDQNKKGFILDCYDDDDKTVHIFNSNTDEEIKIEDIAKDSVLRCITDNDQINIVAYLCVNSVYGRITKLDKEENIIEIDGVSYKFNGYYKNYYSSYSVGTDGEFYYADDGTVTALKINKTPEPPMKYGYLIKATIRDSSEQPIRLTVITNDGSIKKIFIKDRCIIDGKREKNVLDTSVKNLFIQSSGDTKFQLIRYSEADGICSKVDTLTSNYSYAKFSNPVNTNDTLYISNARDLRKYKSLNGLFLPWTSSDSFRITENTSVFYVPSSIGTAMEATSYNDDDFQSGLFFKNDQRYTVESYNIDKSGAVEAVVVYAATKPEVGTTSSNGVIYSISDAWEEEEDIITKLITYYDGNRFNNVYLSEKALKELNSTSVTLKIGDIIRFDLNMKGMIEAINVDYSHTRGTVFPTSGEDGAFEITKLIPKYVQDGYMIGMNGTKQNLYKIDGVPLIEINEGQSKEMKKSSLDVIKCSDDYGSKASEVVLIMTYSSPKLLVVYNTGN